MVVPSYVCICCYVVGDPPAPNSVLSVSSPAIYHDTPEFNARVFVAASRQRSIELSQSRCGRDHSRHVKKLSSSKKQYGHRLRQLIQNARDLDLAVRHDIPRSTARGRLKQPRADVVSIDVLDNLVDSGQALRKD